MKTEIEVEWKARPNTGITNIPLSDLGVKTEKQWNSLSEKQKTDRINDWLKENEEPIVAKAVSFY